jgi:hypothetical protein
MNNETSAARSVFPARTFLAGLLLLSLVGGDCGPSPAEAGGAVLLASPVAFLAGLVALSILHTLWLPLKGPMRMDPLRLGAAFLALCGLAALGPLGSKGSVEWWGVAVLAFGTSYVSVLLIVWRIWLHQQPKTASTWAPIAVMAFMLVPAPFLLAINPSRGDAEPVVSAWILPGMFGYATIPIFVVVVGEALVRRLRHRPAEANQRSSEPRL